jgi:hypothetical protein
MGEVINSGDRVGRGQIGGRLGERLNRRNMAWIHFFNRKVGESGTGIVVSGKAATGFVVTDVESSRSILANDASCAKIREHTEVLDDGHTEDGINGHIVAKTKRDTDRATIVIDVWGFISDNSGKLAMQRYIIIVGMADGAAKLDRFKGIRIVELFKAGDNIRILAHDPEMIWQITGAQSGT